MDLKTMVTDRKWVLPLIAGIFGITLGVLYAWVINPVQFKDGEPHQLRPDLREDYLRMVVDSYSINLNAGLAVSRYNELGEFKEETLEAVGVDPGEVDPTAIQKFRALIEIEQEFTPSDTEGPASPEEEETSATGFSQYLLPICGITAVLGVLLAGALVLRRRLSASEEYVAEEVDEFDVTFPDLEDEKVFVPEEGVATGDTLATFRTIYSLGDDQYDDSFSIESPTGDFLGECGVGVGDIIGVGEPNKVSAFEVWLFDKNDIQTVTKVMLSNYAYNDETTRNRLAAKGDPVLAESGGVIQLDTASLRVEARIVDMTYGEGALPPESFFERVTIELRAWPREG
jgi:hypothetical protein